MFEPDPALPLGLSCLFAQVRSCAAPCLARVSEDDYRELARGAADLLARPEARPPEMAATFPPAVAPADGNGLVVAPTKAGVELYPVKAGTVLEEGRVIADEAGLDAALEALRWDTPHDPRARLALARRVARQPAGSPLVSRGPGRPRGVRARTDPAGPSWHLTP